MTDASTINILESKHAVVIGGGVIGASWAALFLVNGMTVTVCDPDPAIEAKVQDVIDAAAPTLGALGYDVTDITHGLTFESSVAKAVAHADFIQENGPERPDFKQELWKTIEAAAPADALLLSSSSGIPASVQSIKMLAPGRLVIGHPFNPPHLMPLVEVVPSPATDPAITKRVMEFYKALNKVAMEIRKEIQGFVANRLQSAIFRECMWLVKEGVVTINELDDVVTNSLGIRWATSGPFLSFHLGGGPGGLEHFVKHLGPGMAVIWKTLGAPEFDEATDALLIDQARSTYGQQSYDDLSQVRDAKEVAVINALATVAAAGD